jgi:hypothetical protein
LANRPDNLPAEPEQAALGKLTANWRSLIDQTLSAVETGLFGRQQGS